MLAVEIYRTIAKPSEGVYKEKGSKFLAYAYPVYEVDQVKTILSRHRKTHHDARHHCYAYLLQPDGSEYRVNDDGEPSGTAGKPILGQIKSFHLTYVLIVVIRYFGGTLLGVGGLIRSYRNAAKDALAHAEIIECKVLKKIRIRLGYERLDQVMRWIDHFDIKLSNQHFDTDVTMDLDVPVKYLNELTNKIEETKGIIISKE
ncbi:MAG: YigZ family protein [Bacteroidales bacterium]|nr:YigZ family protein [Bacteroidales bacterium]